MNKTVLSLMAHPDDAEILCGGTLCLLADRGWEIHIATASPGDCGSAERSPDAIAAIRREEGRAAAERLSGTFHCLESRDLRIFYDAETLASACALLRHVRPSLVFTHSPSDYMIDHEETSRIARASCFNAPIPNAPASNAPTSNEPAARRAAAKHPDGPLGHIPHLYYADPIGGVSPLGEAITPDFVLDISTVIERKAELLACHASQRDWLRKHHGIDEYIEGMKRWSQDRGQLIGRSHGEGFRQHLGHAYPEDDLLRIELEEQHHRLPPSRGD